MHTHTRTQPDAAAMSAGDVVCTGWLIKSPPEKKLKRFSWRKRWFVLRRGRMSGNPDVLEYYRSKSSRKPIRTIDLQECEVTIEAEVRPTKRQYENQHLFVVKTATRIFYLLAKTAEEMNIWVQNIGQICTFGGLNRHAESMDSLNRTPSSQQPSPALSPHVSLVANQDTVTVENHDVLDRPSESEISPPLDYLFLSQCETGTKSIVRCDSISNSERSFEQSSSEYTEDVFSPTPRTDSSPSPFLLGGVSEPPFSAPCGPLSLSSSLSSCLSSPISLRRPSDIFRFDRPFYGTSDPQTPPPLPPKPTHLSDHHGNEDTGRNQPQPALLPRRTSLSGIDHFKRGEFDNAGRNWNKRLSLNLPIFLNTTVTENHSEDSYVPMASPPISCSDVTSDGYIPMSPSTLSVSLLTNGKTELPSPSNPDLEPPPVDRNLKPRIRARPPPLDLRGLSTISECPFHVPLTRTMTEPSTSLQSVPLDRRRGWGLNGSEQEGNITPTESRLLFPACDSAPWMRPSQLDYLSLDFNSASPSPVQKKPLLADEYRVDYVQVDEKKTQALQNTKLEWKDVRQSKA
ncbi:GRB2-associated-binding protein 3-like isoform X3 [Sinocyclocheilus rhinocerous]|uniref:GRB2-associated-binding protein 3-like isoform X3 n=1 Tax=Sinocyclocheilus rhinocerous TaxID=307959 RepID=UPI0007B80EB5|nr:PREDICTED: GRB2-associated-binding protein 3-like isoform X3 [Sinocyclocheilus rhinocerous]